MNTEIGLECYIIANKIYLKFLYSTNCTMTIIIDKKTGNGKILKTRKHNYVSTEKTLYPTPSKKYYV